MTAVSSSEVPVPPPADVARVRGIFRAGAPLILFAAVIPVLGGSELPPTLTLHALWASWVLATGELLGRGVFTAVSAGLVSTAGGLLFLPAIVLISGNTGALFYLLLICLPLIIASMAPTDQPSVVLSGVGGLGWVIGLEVHAGHPPARVVAWGLFSVACAAIAGWATVLHRRSEAARRRALAERIAALTRLAEQQRKEARTERLALIGQLTGEIAHELNNPLSFVTANVSYLGGLLRAAPVGDDRLEVLEETNGGLERMGNTIRMLQLFVQPAGGPAIGSVNEAVVEALALAMGRLRRGVLPQTSLAEGIPPVALGHRRLVQMVVNLLLNAADAVQGTTNPRITVTATVTGAAERTGVRLVFEDSGRQGPSEGPASAMRAGLGLALCREHVEEAGGSLTVEATPEGGSRIIVSLPAAAPTSQAHP